MGALWLVGSFVIGHRAAGLSAAAIAGLVSIESAIVVYYAAERLAVGHAGTLYTGAVWAALGAISGPVLGIAGYKGASRIPMRRCLDALALAGPFVLEALAILALYSQKVVPPPADRAASPPRCKSRSH
jgi:hypothetical protein